jgi:hypothetical protein
MSCIKSESSSINGQWIETIMSGDHVIEIGFHEGLNALDI